MDDNPSRRREESVLSPSRLYNGPFQLALASGLGLLLGLASLRLSPQAILVVVVAVVAALVVAQRPELGLLGILGLTSTIVFDESLPLIRVGVGSLHISDALLLTLLAFAIVRSLAGPNPKVQPTPLDLPLLAFYGAALLSTVVALLQASVASQDALRELRLVTYYLSFFVVTRLVRETRQIVLLLRGISLLATVVAAAMVVQFGLGDKVVILPGRVETLGTQGQIYEGITRILPPGQSLVQVAFIVTGVTLVVDGFRSINVLRFLQWGLLGLAVILTFNRSFWVGGALALLILACLVGRQGRRRLAGWGLLALTIVVLTLLPSLSTPDSSVSKAAAATLYRAGTLTSSKTVEESSLRMRYAENSYVIHQILSHPFLGLGLGARYRPMVPGVDYIGFDGRAYVHNAHFWILVKTGLLGYLSLMCLSLLFLVRSLRHWNRVRGPELRGATLGFALTYVGVLVGGVVDPMFAQSYWIPIIGIMMGINEVVLTGVANQHVQTARRQYGSWSEVDGA